MRKGLSISITFLTTLFIFFSCTDSPKKVQENELIARSFIEAWSKHDSEKLTSLFDEECHYEEVPTGRNFTYKKDIAEYMNNTLSGMPDSEFVVESIIASENTAMVEWIWKGTNSVGWDYMDIPATDKYFEIKGVSVMAIENSLIIRNRDYWDWNTFMKGIGIE